MSIVVQTLTPLVLVTVLQVPKSFVGWAIAGFWIANALGALLAIGVIRNRGKSTLIGFAVLAVSFAGFAVPAGSLVYVGDIALSGLGLSIVQTFVVPSMYLNGSKERPHGGIGSYSTALSIGMISGPLCAAFAISFFGYSSIFWAFAALSVFAFAFCLRIGFQKSFDGEDTIKGILPSMLLKTLRQKGFTSYYSLNFLYSMTLPILLSYGGIFAESKFGISTAEALGMFTAIFAISTIARTFFSRGKVSEFRNLLWISFALLVVSFVLIGTASTFLFFLIGFLIFSIPHALIYPSVTFLALQSGGSEGLLSTTYLFATSSGVAEFLAPLIAVPIIVAFSLSSLFVLFAPVAIIGFLLALSLPRLLENL